MFNASSFYQLQLPFTNYRTYSFAVIFITGNLLLPQLTHLVPDGGRTFLPIYFFTLLAGYKFGIRVGLLTAVLSPAVNNLLFGMPPAFVLPAILVKSCLLAVIAAITADHYKRISLLNILFVVLAYQLIGSAAEWFLEGSFQSAIQDFTIGIPGMLLQVFGGYAILKNMSHYGNKSVE